ncbi:MAG: photosystem I reaction center subunit IV [Gammaproteobacteria bacterium]|nr:photosystem I reaction center subunit IV [Gammaproteobacteria bacterium]MBT8109217.1 photosystem I reaction center subunit IV [Gammaproteobacteria bacterium]NND46205.1 photosystem I reaction center subunit IV [Woeseiaceae bacterium]NNL43919.1 photosystem I reaction center subunit IV [Woeseiaceae bacterium]
MNRGRLIVGHLSVVLLVIAGYVIANENEAISFAMLPAIKTESAQKSLLLDAAAGDERILVVGEQGHILYSDDQGSNWTHADVPVSLAITAVTFAAMDSAWATAHDGVLLQSTDNGASWQVKLTGTDVARLSVTAAEEQVKLLEAALEQATPETREDLEWALDDATFAVDDAKAAIEEGVTTPLLNVWFANENNGYALGAYGVFLRTSDGGSTWSLDSNRLDNPDKYHLYDITRSSAGTLLVAGEAGTLLRSRDGGQTWERPESPYQGSFFGAVATTDGSLLVFGLKGNIFRSVDEGVTWSAIKSGDQRTLLGGMTRTDGTIVLMGSAGAVLFSDDNGRSFRTIPTTGNRVYSGGAGTADGRLLLVGFGGVSFIDSNAVSGGPS